MAFPLEATAAPGGSRNAAILALGWCVVGLFLAPSDRPPLQELRAWPAYVSYAAQHPTLRAPEACSGLVSAPPALDHEPAAGDAGEFLRRCEALQREIATRGTRSLALTADRGPVQPGLLTRWLPQPGVGGALLHAALLALALPWLLALWGPKRTAALLVGGVTAGGLVTLYTTSEPFTNQFGPASLSLVAGGAVAWRLRRHHLDLALPAVDLGAWFGGQSVPLWAVPTAVAVLSGLGVGLEGGMLDRWLAAAAAFGAGMAAAEAWGGSEAEHDAIRAELAAALAALAPRRTGVEPADDRASASEPSGTVTQTEDPAAPTEAPAASPSTEAAEPTAPQEPLAAADGDDVFAALLGAPQSVVVEAPQPTQPEEQLVERIPLARPPVAATLDPGAAVAAVVGQDPDSAVAALLDAIGGGADPADIAVAADQGSVGEPTRAARPEQVAQARRAVAQAESDPNESTRAARPEAVAAARSAVRASEQTRALPNRRRSGTGETAPPPDDLPSAGPEPANPGASHEPTATHDPATVAIDDEVVRALRFRSATVPTTETNAATAAYSEDEVIAARAAIARSRDPRTMHEAQTQALSALAAERVIRLRERGSEGFVAVDLQGRDLLLDPRRVVGVVAGMVPSPGAPLPEGDVVLADLYVRRDAGIERWRLPASSVHFARIMPGLRARDGWQTLLREVTEAGASRLPEQADWPEMPALRFASLESFEALGRRLLPART